MISDRLAGYAGRTLERRLEAGKEHPTRLGERRGEPSQERPAGTLIWFHAASVGESLSLLLLPLLLHNLLLYSYLNHCRLSLFSVQLVVLLVMTIYNLLVVENLKL